MTPTFSSLTPRIAVSLFLLLGLGCKRNEAPDPPTMAKPTAMTRQEPSRPTIAPPPRPTGSDALAWQLPKGWTEARTGGMRFATLKPPTEGNVDVSVVMLPGAAGGELANVNRWRGQIGLPPVDEASRAQVRKEVPSKAGMISVYDFTNEAANKQRMVVGLLLVDGRSWFLKMVGDASAIEPARADFLDLLATLHSPGGK
jgi:hypothetical protein